MAFFYSSSFPNVKMRARGFTLIELLVVVAIVGVLFIGIALAFNPVAQLNKSQNAVRQHDLEQIKSSLDMYYDDMGCYPTSLTFFRQFASNNKIYMNTIPEDPKCQNSGQNCYVYQTDTTSSCPQWNVLYATLATPVGDNATCPLTAISANCIPTDYQSLGFNYCVPSGKLDCSQIGSSTIGSPSPPPGGVGYPTPTQGVCQAYYACTGTKGNACNSLGSSEQKNCQANGGSLVCYCDTQCSNQCQ